MLAVGLVGAVVPRQEAVHVGSVGGGQMILGFSQVVIRVV